MKGNIPDELIPVSGVIVTNGVIGGGKFSTHGKEQFIFEKVRPFVLVSIADGRRIIKLRQRTALAYGSRICIALFIKRIIDLLRGDHRKAKTEQQP